MADQEAGISHITFEECSILIDGQTYIRVIAVEAFIYDHGIAKPEKSILVERIGGLCFYVGQTDPLFVLGKKCGNLLENGSNP